jgi:hypothetical protein
VRAVLAILMFGSCVALAACFGSGESVRSSTSSRSAGGQPPSVGPPGDAVAYTLRFSTDPHGGGTPQGIGVATALVKGSVARVEIHNPGLGLYLRWVGPDRLAAQDVSPHFLGPAELFSFRDGRLTRVKESPLRATDDLCAWSPNRKLIAIEPSRVHSCGTGQTCAAPSGSIFLENADGSHRRQVARGTLSGWSPSDQLVLSRGSFTGATIRGRFESLALGSGQRRTLLATREVAAALGLPTVSLGDLRWSADGRYLAALVTATWERSQRSSVRRLRGAVVLAKANGRIIRFLTSRYQVSMFAWSPRGHRLAYTTSGVPTPHQLLVVDGPQARPRKLFATSRHFDWVTWSPNDRWLLVDDQRADAWRLIRADGSGTPRVLPRLGGTPLWCCPQDQYGGG